MLVLRVHSCCSSTLDPYSLCGARLYLRSEALNGFLTRLEHNLKQDVLTSRAVWAMIDVYLRTRIGTRATKD